MQLYFHYQFFVIVFILLLISGCIQEESTSKRISNKSITSKIYDRPHISNNSANNSQTKSKEEPLVQIYPEVWSQHSPLGESWEFKVNCFGIYSKLEECFLWDLDLVQVITPTNSRYHLKKDFNVNNYSGEVTRRWVLYGPANESLPVSGNYTFLYSKHNTTIYTQTISYAQSKIAYPTNVKWSRKANDLYVTWTRPFGVDKTMNYKVIIWNEYGTPQSFVSKVFPWDAQEGTLQSVPFIEGGNYSLNVAIFFKGGYAYSEYVKFTWNS